MKDADTLLQLIARDSAGERPHANRYDIELMVGGEWYLGHVISPRAFAEDALPELVAREYGSYQDGDSDHFLHMHVRQGPGKGHKVRFRLDGIDAWWFG
ncbi:hypothetical protein [Streptomyces sp. NPDC001340]